MHVGIIMDGNRRWAKKHLFETITGHSSGAKTLAKIVGVCPKYSVDTLTVYALSGENLTKRSAQELNNIFTVMIESASKYQEELVENGVKVIFIGDTKSLSEDLQKSITDLAKATENGSKLKLQICLNYTGRAEIVEAVNQAISSGEKSITEQIITKYINLSTDPDLIIRPGGEFRLSNFLTWQSIYSELYFTDILWPDFDETEFVKAIEFYHGRSRRLGK